MKSVRPALFAVFSLASRFALAQRDDGSAALGCFACGSVLFFWIAILAINIALLVWVAKDAKARGMDGGILWMLLVLFTSLFGLIIYLLVRPKGDLVKCPNCGNKKLLAAMRCPHCGYGALPGA